MKRHRSITPPRRNGIKTTSSPRKGKSSRQNRFKRRTSKKIKNKEYDEEVSNDETSSYETSDGEVIEEELMIKKRNGSKFLIFIVVYIILRITYDKISIFF